MTAKDRGQPEKDAGAAVVCLKSIANAVYQVKSTS